MLLDDLMPHYDVVERHRTIVRASPAVVFESIRAADLAGAPITRTLLAVRAVPAALAALVRSPRAAWAEYRDRSATRRRGVRLEDFERAGFRVVAERAPDELVIGLLGRFWTPRGALCADVSAASFRAGPPAGQALAGWNFTVAPRADGWSELRTETRVWCAEDARWKFRLYWLAVRPGSGLIRRAMLRSIRQHAEHRAGSAPTEERRTMPEADAPQAAAPTRELVVAKLNAIFPASEQERVLALLDTYEGDNPAGRARVQLAILKLTEADAARVPGLVEVAVTDFRDVLAPAEYPRQTALGFTGVGALSEAERHEIERDDRAQYVAWLLS